MSKLLSDTWLLTRTQLEYRRPTLIFALLLGGGVLAGLALAVDPGEERTYRKACTAFAAIGGVLVGIFGWGVEAAERRVQLHATLPTGRTSISASRFLTAAILQLIIGGAFWLVQQLVLREAGALGTSALEMAWACTWGTALIFSAFLSEEINVALHQQKILLWLGNLLALVLILWGTAYGVGVLEAFGRTSFLVGVIVAVLFAVAGTLLFRVRSNFDVGVSPWHGFPVDWSRTD